MTGAAGLLLAIGVIAGAVPAALAAAAAVTFGCALFATTLVRLALTMRRGRPRAGPCRGAGLLGLATAATGTTAAGTATAAALGGSGPAVVVGTTGTVVVAVLATLGLLMSPGAARTPRARLRRCLDGIGVGIALYFTVWLLVIVPAHVPATVPLLITTTGCVALAVAIVTAARAVRHGVAAVACALGASLTVLGTATVPMTITEAWPPAWLIAAALAQLTGPALIVDGARWSDRPSHPPEPADADGTLAGYPLLAVPLVIAIGAAVLHLARGGRFDRTSATLAIGAVAVLTARETLGTIDIRRYARWLAAREAHFQSLVAESTDVTVVLGTDLAVRWQSPAAGRQFGLTEQDVLEHPFTELIHPTDATAVADRLNAVLAGAAADDGTAPLIEARLRDGAGRWRDTETTVSDQRANPEVAALVLHIRDVGDRKALERSLHRMAWTDQLTGLANRRKLLHACQELRAAGGMGGALLLVTLDEPAAGVGENRDAGDAVLVEAARRLRTGVGGGDVAARLDASEFAVLADVPPLPAYALATRLAAALGEPYELRGCVVQRSASIGVAELHGGDGVEDVLRNADLARRRAAQLGRGRVECFDESIEAALVRGATIERELPDAIGRGELDVVFQPVLELGSRHPVGAETLLRWRHPRLGVVLPAELIPAAESSGLITRIDGWVLLRACQQLSRWRRDGRDLWVSVNVSARQLRDEVFPATVTAALDTTGVPPERLLIELTERGVDGDGAPIAERLAALRALGVRIAIDNFGAAQSAIANLRRLPVDVLKADRALFAGAAGTTGAGGPAAQILEAVVEMSRRLGVEVIATGLESDSQLELARSAGCRMGQGMLLSAPAHAEHVEAFLESHRAPLF